MKSIAYPNMFTTRTTNIVEGKKASTQNLKLLLGSEKGELFGDPDFGVKVKRFLYDQNNYILKDMLIDEIYTQIAIFMPQLRVRRNNIKIVQDDSSGKAKLFCNIQALNKVDFTTDMYSLVLFEEKE